MKYFFPLVIVAMFVCSGCDTGRSEKPKTGTGKLPPAQTAPGITDGAIDDVLFDGNELDNE